MKTFTPRFIDITYLLIALQLILIQSVFAQSTSWTGATSSAWATSTNWTNGLPSATLDVIIGDANFTGSFQPSITATSTAKSVTIGTGTKSSTLTMTARLTVSGNVTIGANGTLAHNATSTTYYLYVLGNFSNSGTYSTINTNALVTLIGTTQSISGTTSTTFQRLTINSGTTTLNQNITVTTLLTVTGILDPNEPTYVVTLSGASVTLNSGATLRVKAATFAGNYTVEPTTVNAKATIDYAAATTNQTISNTITYGILKVSGAMTKTPAGDLPNLQSSSTTGGYITVSAGTLDLQGYAANRNAAGGTVTVSNGATLRIGGTNSFPGNFSTRTLGATSTVEYYGTNQTLVASTYGNLTLSANSGAVVKTLPATAFTIAGALTTSISGGASLTFTAAAILTVTGDVIIGASTTFNASTFSHSFSGNFTNNGTFSSSTGTITLKGVSKAISGAGSSTFYNLTISGAGTTATSGTSFIVAGAFATSGTGTFTHTSGGAGIITLSSASKTIAGAGIAFSNLTISGIITAAVGFTIAGDFTVTNSFTATAGIITLSGTSNAIGSTATTFKVFSLTVSGTYSCSNSLTITSILSVTGSFTASAGIVTFAGVAQPVTGSPNFYALTINSGSTVTLNANITVTNSLTLNGTLDPNEPTYLTTLTGATTFSLGATGILKVKATTFAGNYNINPTSINAAGTVDYAASTVNQTVSSALTYGILKTSGALTKSLAGNLPALTGNVNVAGGTLDLLTYTADRTSAGGTFTVAAGCTLNIGGTNSFPANYTTKTLASTSTVQYSGTNQTVAATTYGNLILSSSSGASVKTMTATAFTVSGNLTSNVGSGTSVTYTAAAIITITGNLNIGASTTFNALTYAHPLAGNFTCDGTFSSTTGTLTMSGASKTISGAGAITFNNLTFSGPGITAAPSTSFTVSGNFVTSGTGTLTHTSGGTGIITLSGTAKTITGTGATFSNLTISGTISTAVALTISGDLTVSNSLITTAAGGITLSGASNAISGAGTTMTLTSLTVSGSYTCSRSFTLSSNLTITGSMTASAGTITFNGTTILGGTANLYNVIINGTSLTMSGSANLGIAATFTKTAGTFDVTTNIPNTVNFNGSGAQNINALPYYHLVLSTGGTKTTAGAITVNGNFTINAGVTFSASSYTHTFNQNILNSGSFMGGTSTVQMSGSTDASITGTTIFNILTISKGSSTNVITVNNNIAVATLNMTTGNMQAGSNTVTITNTRTGGGIITGTVTLTNSFSTGVAYALESPNNTITFTSISGVTSVTETITIAPVSDFPSGAAINREYDFTIPSGSYTANISLHYQNSEVNGNTEAGMTLWKNNSGTWVNIGRIGIDTINNYVSLNGQSGITGRWTISDFSSFSSWTGVVSTAWETPGNWSTSAVPTSTTIVKLGDQVFTNQPVISSAASVRSITFESNTAVTLTFGTGGSLTTNALLSGNISGTWTGNATHTINTSTQNLTVGGNFVMSDGTAGHAINLIIGTGSATVTGALNQTGGANITFNGNGTLNLASNYNYVSGTFTPLTGTITYNGNGSQVIAGLIYYNLTIDKTAGTATSSIPVHITNNLSLNTSATFQTNDSLVIGGNLTINSGTTLTATSSNILVKGNWSNSGTFTAGTSTVSFNGTGAQTTSATTFNNLIINKASGTATLSGNVVVNSNLSLTNGTLDLSTYTSDRNGAGGTFTISSGTTLKIGGASNFPNNYSTNSISSSSTVEYNGTVAQTIKAITFGNLTFSNGTSNAKTLGGVATIAGDLFINSGATFSASSYTLTLQGSWTNSGIFTASTSTVVLTGASKTVTGTTTFNSLNISGSYAGANNITISGTTTLTGTYQASGTTITISGDFTNTGTLSSSGIIAFSGTGAQALQINSGLSTTGTVNFNGTVAPIITSVTAPTFTTLNINNTGGVSPASTWNMNGTCTIASGATFAGGSYTHNIYGTFTNNGTVTGNDTLNFVPTSATTVTLQGTAFSSTGTVVFGGSGALTISGTPGTITNIIISNTAGITLPSSWTIGGDVTIVAGCALTAGTALSHTISGTLNTVGTFNGGTSTISMNGTSKNITGTGSITFYNLTISGGSITALTNFNITSNFTNNATFTSTGYEVAFTGTGASTISGTTTPTSIDILTVNKTSATTTLSVNLNKVSQLNVVNGTLDLTTKTITQLAAGGTLTVDTAATLKIGGTNNIPTFNTYNLDDGSNEEFNGAAQAISSSPVYGNLTISASGNKTPGGALNIAGSFYLSAGTFVGGNNIHNLKGNWNMTGGTFTSTNSTINLNGSGDQSVSSTGNFNNLTINKLAGAVNLSTSITVNGTLTFTSGNISTGSYTVIIPSAGTVSRTSGYVIGNLQRAFASGNLTRVFDVGDANGYSPAIVVFTSISVAGNLIINITSGTHPDVVNSSIDPTKNVNKYWTLTNSGITFTTYGVTFGFAASDMDVSANPTNFIVGRRTGGVWTFPTVGTKTSTSTQCTGNTAFGDFQVGEYGQKVWDGGAGTNNWGDATNWNPDGVPASTDNIVLTGANIINVNVVAVCKDLTLNNSGLTLSILASKSITASGNLTMTSGVFNTAASFPSVTGNTTITGASVNFNGSGAQTIPANSYYNLTLSNAGLKTLASGTSFVTGVFSISGTASVDATTNSTEFHYSMAGDQSVAAISYYNLSFDSSGIKTFAAGTVGIASILDINDAATVDAATNSVTTNYNGSGAQDVVPLNYYSLILANAGTKSFGAGITTISHSLTVSGSATADATSNPSIIQLLGSSQTIPSITYNDLTLSNGGTKSLAGPTVINGTLTLSGTVTLDVTASNYGITLGGNWINYGSAGTTFNAQSGTVTFNGTSTISGSATTTFKNVTINSGKSLSASSSNTIITGNLQNNGTFANPSGTVSFNGTTNFSGSSSSSFNAIVNNGTLNLSSSSLYISGSLTNNATINAGTGAIIFNGSSNQNITSGGTTYYNAIVSNSAGITLLDNFTISNILTLGTGNISTGTNRVVLTSTSSSALTGFNSSSYINGNLRRNIVSNSLTYSFPVGTTTQYALTEIANHLLTGVTYIDGSFAAKPGNDNGLNFMEAHTSYTSINSAGVWFLVPNAEPSAGTYDLKCYISAFTGLLDNSFAILSRPDASTNAADWNKGGGSLNVVDGLGRKVSDGYALRLNLNTFSQKGIGESGSILPIQLSGFEVVKESSKALLHWATSSELDNDHFEIEIANSNSSTSLSFNRIGEVKGKGTSFDNTDYQFIDSTFHYSGTVYYRLKQVNTDSTFTYSEIRSLTFNNKSIKVSEVYPNPVSTFFYMDIDIPDNLIADTYLYNTLGQMVKQQHMTLKQGTSIIKINIEDLPTGIYYLDFYAPLNGLHLNKKLIKN